MAIWPWAKKREDGNDTTPASGRCADGERAESLAADWLAARGLTIVARNYRVRGGEIDLIARDRKVTVFVEVRLRRHAGFGGAGESITAAKRARVILAARHWLAQNPAARKTPCRFDCLLLNGLDAASIDWVRDAFSAD